MSILSEILTQLGQLNRSFLQSHSRYLEVTNIPDVLSLRMQEYAIHFLRSQFNQGVKKLPAVFLSEMLQKHIFTRDALAVIETLLESQLLSELASNKDLFLYVVEYVLRYGDSLDQEDVLAKFATTAPENRGDIMTIDVNAHYRFNYKNLL